MSQGGRVAEGKTPPGVVQVVAGDPQVGDDAREFPVGQAAQALEIGVPEPATLCKSGPLQEVLAVPASPRILVEGQKGAALDILQYGERMPSCTESQVGEVPAAGIAGRLPAVIDDRFFQDGGVAAH